MEIGFWEIALVAVAGLVVLGPERLVETVRVGRRAYRVFQRRFGELQAQVREELEVERQTERETRQRAVRKALRVPSPVVPVRPAEPAPEFPSPQPVRTAAPEDEPELPQS